MTGSLVTVATFSTTTEAAIARATLEQAGIRAWLQEEVTGGQLQFGSALGGIKLQVADVDAETSRNVLSSLQMESSTNPPPWNCPGCGQEIGDGFEICWHCGHEQPTGD